MRAWRPRLQKRNRKISSCGLAGGQFILTRPPSPPDAVALCGGLAPRAWGGRGSVPQRAVLMLRVGQRGTPVRGSGASCLGPPQRNTVSSQLSTHLPGGTCGQCTVPTAVGGQVSPGGCSQSSDTMVPRGGRPGLRPRCPHTQLGRTSCWGMGQSPQSQTRTLVSDASKGARQEKNSAGIHIGWGELQPCLCVQTCDPRRQKFLDTTLIQQAQQV